MLSRWLQHRDGTVLRGSSVRLSRSGLLRVSTVDDSRPVRVLLPVRYGGQAAVARAQLADQGADDHPLALRVGAVTSREEQSRQMERLLSMLSVVTAARERPETYPSVLPVVESFVCTVPGSELGSGQDEHELWCDVMAWCRTNLAELQQVEGSASRVPAVVVSRMAPVVATVQAVHENLGVIHRDITPHNVLVDDAGRLLLADWGIAHLIASDKTSTHTQRLGNLGFSVPPETLRGDTAVGRYTDAWYLGSLLVWQLTGQAPDASHGQGWLPPGLDQAGEQLAVVARGLCTLDPRQRMGLPEAAARLGELVGLPGPVAIPGPVLPLTPSLRTSDSTVLTAPAPGLPSAPDPGAPVGTPAPFGSPVGQPPDQPMETVAINPRSRPRSAPVRPPGVRGSPQALPPAAPTALPAQPGPPSLSPLTPLPAPTAPHVGPGRPAAPPAQPGPPSLSPLTPLPAPPTHPGPPSLSPLAGPSAPPTVGPSDRPAPPAQPGPQHLTPPSLWQQPVAPAPPRQVVSHAPGVAGPGPGEGPGRPGPADVRATRLVGSALPADQPGYTVPYQALRPRGRTTVMSQRPPSFVPPTAPPERRRGRGRLVAVVVVAVVVVVVAVVVVAFHLAG